MLTLNNKENSGSPTLPSVSLLVQWTRRDLL